MKRQALDVERNCRGLDAVDSNWNGLGTQWRNEVEDAEGNDGEIRRSETERLRTKTER